VPVSRASSHLTLPHSNLSLQNSRSYLSKVLSYSPKQQTVSCSSMPGNVGVVPDREEADAETETLQK